MTEVAPAAAAAPAKAPKKKGAARPKKAGPSIGELIVKAVSQSKERSGVSLAALKKALAAGGYDVEKKNSRVKLAVKTLVTKGTLVQTKGTGASGSFKLNKKQAEPKKKAQRAWRGTVGGPCCLTTLILLVVGTRKMLNDSTIDSNPCRSCF
uniref:Histone H1 n=1 Tax=Pygocentrus nattereri TaxID=42514 RepID=A0A3B4DCF1_PYGNA